MEVLPVPQKFLSSGLMTEDINHPHPTQDLFLGDLAKSLVSDLCGLSKNLKIEIHTNVYMLMAPHSSTLAWKIPWTEEPGGLALGSPIFPSGCEGKLGVALESLQGLRDLT